MIGFYKRRGQERRGKREALTSLRSPRPLRFVLINCFEFPHTVGNGDLGGQAFDARAPKKPTIPLVCFKTYSASAGSLMGPPWQRTRISGFTFLAASCRACTRTRTSRLRRTSRRSSLVVIHVDQHVGSFRHRIRLSFRGPGA